MTKNIFKKPAVIFLFSLMVTSLVHSQPPPPPGGGGTSDTRAGSNQTGAPIGGGLFILLGLAAAYGGRKLYQLRKESMEE